MAKRIRFDDRSRADVGLFLKAYGRTSRRRLDPNDRHYDPDLEEALKRLTPEELDELISGSGPDSEEGT